MGLLRLRTHLGEKKRRQIKPMCRQFDCPHFTFAIERDKAQVTCAKTLGKSAIKAVITAEIFQRFALPISGGHLRTGNKANRLGLPNQRTGQAADQQSGGRGRRLFVICIGDAQNIPCILYQSMLKPASGAKEGNLGVASILDGSQRALHTHIGATG